MELNVRCGGLILCGGRSKRMGQPKAWLPFAGTTMLNHVVAILAQVVKPIAVVAAPDQELPEVDPAIRIVRDSVAGRGPLQGLEGGLESMPADVDAVYVSSCDVPFLQPAFIRRLIDLLGDHSICVPLVGGHFHPLAAVYRVGVLPKVRELLQQDRLRPFFLFETVPTRVVEAEERMDCDAVGQSLRNLNTPEEYKSACMEWLESKRCGN